MVFNIVVKTVVIATLEVVCGPQEVKHGMGWMAVERNLIFYADDGRIEGRDHIRIQYALTVIDTMLRLVGPETNLDKTKALV